MARVNYCQYLLIGECGHDLKLVKKVSTFLEQTH